MKRNKTKAGKVHIGEYSYPLPLLICQACRQKGGATKHWMVWNTNRCPNHKGDIILYTVKIANMLASHMGAVYKAWAIIQNGRIESVIDSSINHWTAAVRVQHTIQWEMAIVSRYRVDADDMNSSQLFFALSKAVAFVQLRCHMNAWQLEHNDCLPCLSARQ